MLETLEQTRWDDVHHAYGPAGDTADHLRNLTSRVALVRRNAIDKLIASICHQGSVYSATARAVPFLIEVAGGPSVPDRAAVLELLRFIADGSEVRDEDDGATSKHPAWLDELRRALRDGADVYLRLLDDDDVEVRTQAINVLTSLPALRDRSAPRLREAVANDASETVRAAAIVAIAQVSNSDYAETNAQLVRAFETDPCVACRASAAIFTLPRLRPEPRDDMTAACILVATGGADDFSDPPPNVESWEAAALVALRRANVNVSDEDLSRAAEVLHERRRCTFEHAAALLDVAFRGGRAPASADQLTAGQRKAVEAVAAFAFPRPYTLWGNYADALGRHGLPRSDEAMTKYLGGPLQWRALDRTGKPFWKFW